jgi:predicted RNase H-like nuclease
MDASVCTRSDSALDRVARWASEAEGSVLIAIDAPLGWPRSMGEALATHRAGEEVMVAPNDLFRRATDRHIQRRLGKTPLDVGADRIARTAHAALRLLGSLRARLVDEIPLAWDPRSRGRMTAIEVYPAATLVSHGIRSKGYKKSVHLAERREIVSALSQSLVLEMDSAVLETNADALDAVVCVLAAKDFLEGYAHPPDDPETAGVEGWIWA